MRRLAPVLVLVLVLVLAGGCGAGQEPVPGTASRVLVFSVPGISWSDVDTGPLPTLRAFAADAAVANLATRIGRSQAATEAAYLTIGAGTRAVAPELGGGVTLDPEESYHGEPAAEVLRRRLGHPPEGLVYLGAGSVRDLNESSRYGADAGLVGAELAEGGVARAVIANADLREGRTDDLAYGRSAAAALMDRAGQVPGGEVSTDLLVDDASAAFGVRLDPDAVLDAFDRAWADAPGVVLVEASDLLRAQAYGATSAPAPRREMRRRALEDADRLLARLLERVTDEDAVMVLSPVAPAGRPHLGVAAVRAPGLDAGLLRSATTRRAGYVQLGDVGPTIIELVGLDAPDEVEGRAFGVVEGSGRETGAERIRALVDSADAAAFRDDVLPVTVLAVVALLLVLVTAVVAARVWHRPAGPARPRVLAAARFGALAALGVLPATFLAGPVGLGGGPTPAFAGFLAVVGLVVAAAGTLADRRWPGVGTVVGAGAVVAVITTDVLVGAPLQLNSAFGYSVAVAGRFAGVGNLAFALLSSAAVVTAALVAERDPRRGTRLALVVLAVVLAVDGLPMFGGDVGGVLSMVPAFGLAGLALLGRRIGVRQVVAVGAAAVATLMAMAFIDLARPTDSRTHLARLAEHLVDGRWGPLLDSLGRRWVASFGSGELGAWVVLAMLTAGVAGYVGLVLNGLAGRDPGRWRLDGPAAAAAIGVGVLATVGLVANDSSFALPATMLLVVVPVLVRRAAVEPVP